MRAGHPTDYRSCLSLVETPAGLCAGRNDVRLSIKRDHHPHCRAATARGRRVSRFPVILVFARLTSLVRYYRFAWTLRIIGFMLTFTLGVANMVRFFCTSAYLRIRVTHACRNCSVSRVVYPPPGPLAASSTGAYSVTLLFLYTAPPNSWFRSDLTLVRLAPLLNS